MAWAYSAGVLTSTGATEAAPDSLLAGIAVAQAAAPTLAYVNGFVGWLNNVQVVVTGTSFVIFDVDSQIEFRGTSRLTGTAGGDIVGGVIHGQRSTLILAKSGSNFARLGTGATFITRRDSPQDPAARIVQTNNVRVDYPSTGSVGVALTLAKIDVNGLDYYSRGTAANVLVSRFYATTSVSTSITGIRIFTVFPQSALMLFFSATYADLYSESLSPGSEATLVNTVLFDRPTYYRLTPVPIAGLPRSATLVFRNPTFLNNCWDQTIALDSGANGIAAENSHNLQYSFRHVFREGLTALEGVTVRYTPERVSGQNITWTPPTTAQVQSAVSNSGGTFAALNLTDMYREGINLTSVERFRWSAKARRYDRRTAGEKVFEDRVLYQGGVNLSAGYTEEVQMLAVPNLTLNAAQAAALTGIAMTASGETGGTVTITENRTALDMWHYYRAWIATLANFSSADSWTYDGTTLNTGAWNVVVGNGVNLNANVVTSGVVTVNGTLTGGIVDANGDSFLSFDGIDAWEVYSDPARATLVDSGIGSEIFRFNYVPATTYYLTVIAGGTTYQMTSAPTASGETVVSLETPALLLTLQALVSERPTLPQIEASTALAKRADVAVVNDGVQRASLLIPHTVALP